MFGYMFREAAPGSAAIESKGLVDALAGEHLHAATFSSEFEELNFPGEGGVSHYEMIFSLPEAEFSDEEKAMRGGAESKPGIRVWKGLKEIGNPRAGWRVALERVVLKEGRVLSAYGAYEAVEIDLQSGAKTLHRKSVRVDKRRKVEEAYRVLLRQIKDNRDHLIDAAFSERKTGTTYRLKPTARG